MKKSISIFLIMTSIFMLIGCTSNESNSNSASSNGRTDSKSGIITCSKTETDDDGYETIDTMEVTYKNNKITKVKDINISETDPEYLEMSLSLGEALSEKLNEIDGMSVIYTKESENKIKFIMEVEFNKLDTENIKQILGDFYSEEDAFYSTTDITLDEFKTKSLEGYNCN